MIMHNRKPYIHPLQLVFVILCGILVSCSKGMTPSWNDGKNCVVLSVAVNGNLQTRAPEKGWDDGWNENLVKTLDLFIFDKIGLKGPFHHEPANNYTDPQDNTYYQDWIIPRDELAPEDITVDSRIYLIANAPESLLTGITTEDGLKDIELKELICNGKQDAFVMTGTGSGADDNNSEVTDKDDVTVKKAGGVTTISVDLNRVASKIRMKINGYDSMDEWKKISYRFVHYAEGSALLESQDETYRESVNFKLSISPSETDLHTIDGSENNNIYDNSALVLYSYPNDWYKPGGDYTNDDVRDEEGNGTDMDDDRLYQQEPIDEEKQTYILLRAPYPADSDNYYFYKVPVNFRLPENSDDVNIKPEDYRHLYRLQRNHLYDITVTIDREGGTEDKPVVLENLEYDVQDYDKIEVEVPSFD